MANPRPKTVQDVHILPLSREVDRAVLPFLPGPRRPPTLHAHRIILLVPGHPGAARVAAKVERQLRQVSIVQRVPLASDPEHPTAGFQGILQQVAGLCRQELDAGHRVHINLSSGSKLLAFAAGLAGMAHVRPGQGSIYYVQPDGVTLSEADFEEHGSTRGVLDVEELDLMPLLLPPPLQQRVLQFLRTRPDGRADYRDILTFLATVPGSGYSSARAHQPRQVRNWNNAITTRMVRTLLSPLAEQGLVEIRDAGRQRCAQLTTRGVLYSSISGLAERRRREPEPAEPVAELLA
jgi:hypothetical protein